jgi:hypothetical protein
MRKKFFENKRSERKENKFKKEKNWKNRKEDQIANRNLNTRPCNWCHSNHWIRRCEASKKKASQQKYST